MSEVFKPQILWIKYKDNYYLILHGGNKDDKMVGLVSREIPSVAAENIREAVKKEIITSPNSLITWMRSALPSVLSKAYREFDSSKVQVINTYNMG